VVPLAGDVSRGRRRTCCRTPRAEDREHVAAA
jgi:hypothetical protein